MSKLHANIFLIATTPNYLGAIFIIRKGIGVGGPEFGNFPSLYVMKISLCREWVVLKSLKTPLRNIKMAPYDPQQLEW